MVYCYAFILFSFKYQNWLESELWQTAIIISKQTKWNEVNYTWNLLRIQASSLTTPAPAARDLAYFAPKKQLYPQAVPQTFKTISPNIKQRSTLLPSQLPGGTYGDPIPTRIFLYFKVKDCWTQGNGMFCCQLLTLEITLNTNHVKVNANKNIYSQNIKTDKTFTSIYKDTHDRMKRKPCWIYLLQCHFSRPLLHNQQTNDQCLPNQTCQRHASCFWKPKYRQLAWTKLIINHLKDKTFYHLLKTHAWPSNSAFEVCNESMCWISHIHFAFGAVKDTEENTICASGSELHYLRKLLKNKMHQVEKQFHQKCEGKAFFIHLFCKVWEQVFRWNKVTLT